MLHVEGPRAADFVALLRRYSGTAVRLDGNEVHADNPSIPPNPYGVSGVLASIVHKVITFAPVIRLDVFRDAPRAGLIDTFFGSSDPAGPGLFPHHRPRTVFVGHLLAIEAHRFEAAAALTGHLLTEYASAAGLNVRTDAQFGPHHDLGLLIEASIIREMTGRPISGRPSERGIPRSGGGITLRRHYGPGNEYDIVFGPQPLNRVLSVTRTNL